MYLFHLFCRAVESLNSKALVKSANTYSRKLCPLLHENLRSQLDKILKADLPLISGAHMTTDHWSSRCNDAYQSLTLHYISKNWEYKKWTVECKTTQGRHTGESIAALTDSMITNIPGLKEDCYKTMTTDTASNMIKAMEESLVIDKHFKCVDHIINVCVLKALEDESVSQAVQKCKDLASATHRSSSKTEKLKNTAREIGGINIIFQMSVFLKFEFVQFT